jgi:hypothetical protein
MTAAGVQNSPPGALPAPLADRPAAVALRLLWLRLAAAVTLLGARDSGRRPARE